MLKIQLENQTGLCFDKGVCISHLPDVERIFEVSINVHSLQDDGHAEVIPVMNVNLHSFGFWISLCTLSPNFAGDGKSR